MSAPAIDREFPEVIEACLDHGVTKCIAFNRRGTLLAAGCSDGNCVVWDFQTRGIAKELKDKDCVASITSVCWSKSGHHILVSASDNSLTLWDVAKGEKVFQTTLQQTPLQAHLHPNSGASPPSLCLVSPFSSAPFILNFHTNSTTVLPISFPDSGTNKFSDGSPHYTPTAACFNKSGDLVYLGNSVGEILIIDHQQNRVCGIFTISGGAVIKNIIFSRNGKYLLTNSSDRTIRIYENLLPLKDSLKTLDNDVSEIKKLKGVGLKRLSIFREFQDSVTKVHWKAPCFSGDSEWVVGGSASKGEHKIYVWDRAGLLVNILEGPTEALVDLAWHPVHAIVVSVSLTGLAYIWVKDDTEEWSAFAPDFRELDENEEYVEQEDEFDLMPDTGKVKESCLNEDDEVDIITVEKDSAFSDSDISQDELCYLPAQPSLDVLEKPLESNKSGSPLRHDSSEIEVVKLPESSNSGSPLPHDLSEDEVEKLPESNNSGSPHSHDSSEDEIEKLPESNNSGSPHSHNLSEDEIEKLPESSNNGSRLVLYSGETEIVKLPESSYSGSPLSLKLSEIEVVENSVAENTGGTCYKRKQKRSKKLSELQDFNGTQETKALDFSLMAIVPTPNGDESTNGSRKAKSPNLGKLRSKVWNHFKKQTKSNNEIVAVCNYCSRNFSGGVTAGTSHLRNHVERKHAQFVFPEDCSHVDGVSTPNGNESVTGIEEVDSLDQGNLTSVVWDHFKKFKKPNNEVVAVCNYCSKNIVARDGGACKLRNHLKRKHAKISSINRSKPKSVSTPKVEESMMEVEEVNPPTEGNKKSMDWVHFQKVEKSNNKVVAVCKHCSKELVPPGDDCTKLRNHLKRKHAELISTIDCVKTENVSTPNVDEPITEVEEVNPSTPINVDEPITEDEEVNPSTPTNVDGAIIKIEEVYPSTPINVDEPITEVEEVNPSTQRQRSMVWDHFEKVKKPENKIVAVCNHCSATFVAGTAGTSNLRNHLKRKHQELIVTSKT